MTVRVHGETWRPWRSDCGVWCRDAVSGVKVTAWRSTGLAAPSGRWCCRACVAGAASAVSYGARTRAAAFRAAVVAYQITAGRKP